MIVDLITCRNWAGKAKMRDEGHVIRIVNSAFFLKGFSGKGVEDGVKFKELKEALENRLSKLRWALTFVVKCDEEAGPRHKWSVSVRGEILKELQQILYDGDEMRNLKLVVKEVGVFGEEEGLRIERVASDLEPVDFFGDGDLLKKHFCYSQKEMEVPALEEELNRDAEWGLSLQLVIEDQE